MKIQSRPCREIDHPEDTPRVLELELTEEQAAIYNSGKLIQHQLPDQPPEVRERFVSGMCPHCWNEIFADVPEEDL